MPGKPVKNLVETPSCEIQIAKLVLSAKARTLEGDERAKWWPLITQEQPEQGKYEARTSCVIPVVVFDLQR